MWLFSSPKNYSEMLKKIATTMFFFSLIIIVILSHIFDSVSSFMESISFGLYCIYGGLKLYISYFYFPLLFAVTENIFKLHDRISDLFGIRYRFDTDVIIKKYLAELNLLHKTSSVNRSNRNAIMHSIFYKYASSTSPKIDRHLIDLALGAWSWYWIIIDTLACIIVVGSVWLANSFSWSTFNVLFGINLTCLVVIHFIYRFQCTKYALLEVEAILQLKDSRDEIMGYLNNAL